MRTRLLGSFGALATLLTCSCSATNSGAGPGGAGVDGGTGVGGSAAPPVTTVAEKEPNDGPDYAGFQDLGTFDAPKTIKVTGKLETGGNDGQKYTGDIDGFMFTIAAAGGNMSATVDWTGDADVDAILYDASLNPIAGDAGAAKPIKGSAAIPAGKYAIVLFSKDKPADWTISLDYTKAAPTGTGGSCTSPLSAAPAGGCVFNLIEPANGESVTLPRDFGVKTCSCETPLKIHIYGDPPTAANRISFEYSRAGTVSNCWFYARKTLAQADLSALTSASGVYHWQVEGFFGATSEARTFTVAPAVCK